MNAESLVKCRQNPVYENVDKPASLELSKPTQGSNRALFALVIIIVGLISLATLLLTIVIMVEKTGSSNEGQCMYRLILMLDKLKPQMKCIISVQLSHWYSVAHWYSDLNPGPS